VATIPCAFPRHPGKFSTRFYSPWSRRPLSFDPDQAAYLEKAGFPSGLGPDWVGACWGETSVDGALAETCGTVADILRDVVGSTLIYPGHGFSSRRSLDDRPFVEAFFKRIASSGFQRLAGTTGGSPEDRQGRAPEDIAVLSRFQVEYAEELLDVLIANYNATPHSALGYRSPLEYLEFLSGRHAIDFRNADPGLVQGLLSYRKRCRVQGGLKEGRRPYVQFEGARYANETLGQRHDLAGTDIWVVHHLEDDARVVQAATAEGLSLGILRAAPAWHRLPHSLAVRRAVQSCLRRRMFAVGAGADAIETFIRFVETQKDRKLPIHPAYLEVRRILVRESEARTGAAVLDAALHRLAVREDPPAPSESAQGGTSHPPLPTRRMAVSD
jgi:hypothetical protein